MDKARYDWIRMAPDLLSIKSPALVSAPAKTPGLHLLQTTALAFKSLHLADHLCAQPVRHGACIEALKTALGRKMVLTFVPVQAGRARLFS